MFVPSSSPSLPVSFARPPVPAVRSGAGAPGGLRAELAATLPLLHARALRLARDPRQAEDLVQDTCERALRFEATFATGTNLKAWLQQVLYSVFVSRCRRQRRERRALAALLHDPCAWTHGEGELALCSLPPRLARALDALPGPFAAVIRLVDLDERAYKDAARELGVPVGTVMSRLFRGRRLLAAALLEVVPPSSASNDEAEARAA